MLPFEVKTLPLVPGATNCGDDVPFPRSTLLAVKVVAPVPPEATAMVVAPQMPELIVPNALTLPDASKFTDFPAGYVTNTSFIPAEKFNADGCVPELLDKTVVLASVFYF